MNEKRKVIIYAGGVKDYSAAIKFGEAVFVDMGTKDIRQVGRNKGVLLDTMIKMKRAGEPAPYLCLQGHHALTPLLCITALAVWEEAYLLIFDAKTGEYVERRISWKDMKDYIQIIEGNWEEE